MRTIRLTVLALLIMLAACARQPEQPTAPVFTSPPRSEEYSVETYVTGIDPFDDGKVWGLNTENGVFVVGPEVSDAKKTTVFERIMDARDEVILIRYRNVPAGDGVVAHKRVTSMVIQETPYFFSY